MVMTNTENTLGQVCNLSERCIHAQSLNEIELLQLSRTGYNLS